RTPCIRVHRAWLGSSWWDRGAFKRSSCHASARSRRPISSEWRAPIFRLTGRTSRSCCRWRSRVRQRSELRLDPNMNPCKMRLARLFLVFACAIATASPAAAASLASRDVLPNGIRLLVAARPSIPIVVLRAYVRAGSAYDPADAPGLANLTAELLTRGTAKRTGPELDRAIEFVGGSLEADAGRDGATVSLAVLKKDLDLGLDLLTEVLLTPSFPEDELRRKVVEIEGALQRSEENPEVVAGRALARDRPP